MKKEQGNSTAVAIVHEVLEFIKYILDEFGGFAIMIAVALIALKAF